MSGFFGSKCYHLELCSSDVDVVVILAPGQNCKRWLDQLRERVKASEEFTSKKKGLVWDTFQTEFLGVPVDIKVIKNSRASDFACRSTDTLRFMIDKRMKHQGYPFRLKLRAIHIFKLVCHHLHVVQHHWKNSDSKFKVASLSFWQSMCSMTSLGETMVWGISSSLCVRNS